MNVLDNIINDIQNLSANEIFDRLSTEICKSDFPAYSNLGCYPQFIQDIILIIDLDTELSMEGICGVLENSIANLLPQIIKALHNIGAKGEANTLSNIYAVYQTSPNSENIDSLARKRYLYTDFDIWTLLETYIEQKKTNISLTSGLISPKRSVSHQTLVTHMNRI